MEQEQVKEHFRKQAADYIGLMQRLIPQYTESGEALCNLIPFERRKAIRVLDLGAGPGVLSELVLQKFEHAQVVVFDLTEEMLQMSARRLAVYDTRVEVVQGDYTKDSFGSGYDVILAGLTLHHLEDAARREIFSKLFASLNAPGIFLAREIVVDGDPSVTDWHYALWRAFMRAGGEDDNFWYAKHREKDHPVSVEKQLDWLRAAGFQSVGCHWRYWNFAILSGAKIVP